MSGAARKTSSGLRRAVGQVPREVDRSILLKNIERRAARAEAGRKQKKAVPRIIKQTWHDTKSLGAVFKVLKMPPELVIRTFREIPVGLEMELKHWEKEQLKLSAGFWKQSKNPKIVARALGILESELLRREILLPKEMVAELKKK